MATPGRHRRHDDMSLRKNDVVRRSRFDERTSWRHSQTGKSAHPPSPLAIECCPDGLSQLDDISRFKRGREADA